MFHDLCRQSLSSYSMRALWVMTRERNDCAVRSMKNCCLRHYLHACSYLFLSNFLDAKFVASWMRIVYIYKVCTDGSNRSSVSGVFMSWCMIGTASDMHRACWWTTYYLDCIYCIGASSLMLQKTIPAWTNGAPRVVHPMQVVSPGPWVTFIIFRCRIRMC